MTRFGNHDYPSRWEELTPDQWLGVVAAMTEFSFGRCNFNTLRFRIADAVLGGVPHDASNRILCENIFRISELFSWMYRYSYNDDRFNKLSEETRRQLQHHLPSELDASNPEIRVASSFSVGLDFDLCFGAQLLPVLPSDPKMKGYDFRCSGPLAATSMTAGQYISAIGLLNTLSSSDEYAEEVLSSLVDVLYREDGQIDRNNREEIKASFTEKMAVMYNFRAVNEWVSRIPKYDLVFRRSSGGGAGGPLGMESSIYTLSEKGYGDIDKVSEMDLFTYLDIMLKQTIDSIISLHSCKMKPYKIAEELNLSIDQVISITSKLSRHETHTA